MNAGRIRRILERHRRGTFVAVLASSIAAPIEGQSARRIATDAPLAELNHEFTRIQGVFELPDGRLVVVDQADASIWLADPTTNQVKQLGRQGAGPREYGAPSLLYPLGGDSVGVLDEAYGRIVVITKDGYVAGSIPLQSQNGPRIGATQGDGRGFLYGEVLRRAVLERNSGRTSLDSAAIVRWSILTREADTVAFISRKDATSVTLPGATPALTTRDAWLVASDGRLAFISADPFQVTYLLPGGKQRNGGPIEYRRQSVNDSVKRAFLEEHEKTSTAIVANRGGSTRAVRSSAPQPVIRSWVKEVPPFRPRAFIAFDANILWIQRASFGREPTKYDLISDSGSLLARVELPGGLRMAGFGSRVFYTIRRDPNDIEHLQVRRRSDLSR